MFLAVEGLNRFILIKRLDRVPVDQEIETESKHSLDYKPSEMMGLALFKSVTADRKTHPNAESSHL